MRGTSDQAGCSSSRARSHGTSEAIRASAATRMAVVVSSSCSAISISPSQIFAVMPAGSKTCAASAASLPRGAAIKTAPPESSTFFFIGAGGGRASRFFNFLFVQDGNAGQDAAERIERRPDADPSPLNEQFTDGMFVFARPLFDHRDG